MQNCYLELRGVEVPRVSHVEVLLEGQLVVAAVGQARDLRHLRAAQLERAQQGVQLVVRPVSV